MNSSPHFTANYQAVGRDFDLSRNSSLRTLETTAVSITEAAVASGFLKAVLSTVTSPLPLDLIINYGLSEVRCYRPYYVRAGNFFKTERAAEDLLHLERFKMFSEMYRVHEFRLVLCAEVYDWFAEEGTRALECVVEAERMNGGFDYLSCEPLVICARLTDFQVNMGGKWAVAVCLL